MITTEIQTELKRRLPGIVDSYGGITNFISFVRETLDMPYAVRERGLPMHSKAAMYQYLQTLITYSNDVIMVSPWNLFLDLRLTLGEGQTTADSVNLDEPYRVFTTNGDLLYTVKNHFGAFGESRLDKNLIINSTNAAMYFLKFKSYNGKEQIKVLLVNMYSKRTEIANRFLRKVSDISSSTLSIVNQTGVAINIYEVQSSLMDTSIFDFQQDQYRSVIQPNDVKIFNVDQSKYFYLENSAEIERTVVTNPVNDIIFEVIPSKIIFVASNVDTGVLNRKFNRGLQFSNRPIQDVITLKPLGI